MDNKQINRYYVPPELTRKDWAGLTVSNVYGFMLNRYNFFLLKSKDNQKDVYFESQKNIAETVGVSERSVVNCIALLKEHGYLSYSLIRQGNSFKNSYIVYDLHKIMNIPEKNPTKSKKKSTITVNPDNQDEDIPEWMRV